MTSPVEMTDEIPPAAATVDAADDVTLYGVWVSFNAGRVTALLYGFCFQGHCYRLAIPATYVFRSTQTEAGGNPGDGLNPVGCGYKGEPGYKMWSIEKTDNLTRVERRKGTAEELILDFNLPGRSPATLTYSAKVQIATKAGKIHD